MVQFRCIINVNDSNNTLREVIVIIRKNEKRGNFTIFVKDNNVDKAIRKMKNKLSKSGILKDYRARSRYEKPSDIKIRKQKEGKINAYRDKKKREQNL